MYRDDMTFYKSVKHMEISMEISSETEHTFISVKLLVPPFSSVQAFLS